MKLLHIFSGGKRRLASVWSRCLFIGSAIIIASGSAQAITFTVFPISITLSVQVRSETLTLHNHSDEPIRFQLSAFAWDQKTSGEMVLNSTEDIIFFPQLLTLEPNQERNVRVGTTTPPGDVEKTYRIFVEELAEGQKPRKGQNPEVNVLTKMGLPIFIQPGKLVAAGHIDDVHMSQGVFHFKLNNTGNVHFTAESVHVNGFGSSPSPIFGREATGWYVLAGESREFELQIPKADCSKIRTLAVEVKTDQTPYTAKYDLPSNACIGATSHKELSARAK